MMKQERNYEIKYVIKDRNQEWENIFEKRTGRYIIWKIKQISHNYTAVNFETVLKNISEPLWSRRGID